MEAVWVGRSRNVVADGDPTMLTEKTRTIPIDKRISDVTREGRKILSLANGGIGRRPDVADGRHNGVSGEDRPKTCQSDTGRVSSVDEIRGRVAQEAERR